MAAVGKKPGIGGAGKKAQGMAGDLATKYGVSDAKDADKPNAAALRDKIKRETGPGKAPDTALREKLSGPLGADPKNARLHTGPAAAAAAGELKASAFTIGQDVFFGANKYDPTTSKGMALIAHESTHVLQQTGAKGNVARFFSQRGGDDMEQEAQATAQLVLSDLGKRESLYVTEFIRNYSTESGEHVTPLDRSRLDRISLQALKHAQKELRKRPSLNIPTTRELAVDLQLDLAEMGDEEAIQVWGEAILDALVALSPARGVGKLAVQRDPAASVPPVPASVVSVKAKMMVDDPEIRGKAYGTIVLSASAEETYESFREVGLDNMSVMEALARNLSEWAAAHPASTDATASPEPPPGTTNPDPSDTKFDEKMAATMPFFKKNVQAFYKSWTEFQENFRKSAVIATVALIKESRARVHLELDKYGIKPAQYKGQSGYSGYDGNAEALKPMVAEAQELAKKQKAMDDLAELRKDTNSSLHQLTTRDSVLEKERKKVQDEWMPTKNAFEEARSKAIQKYPIFSYFDTAFKLRQLEDPHWAAQHVGGQYFQMLRNLDDLESTITGDNRRILELKDNLEVMKKGLGLIPFESATVTYMREKYTGDTDTGKKVLQAFAVILGVLAAAPSGGASMIAVAAVLEGGINTVLLLQALDEYNLQASATATDPDKAKSLSKDDPSFFWLALNIVQTLVGLKTNMGQLSKVYKEIRDAAKLAQTTGETAGLAKTLKDKGISDAAAEGIISQIAKESKRLLEGIVKNGPEGIAAALEMLKTSPSFYGARLAVWRLKAGTAESIVKQNLQAARQQVVNKIIADLKPRYPKITFTLVDQGFEKPIVVSLGGSTPAPPHPSAPPPTGVPSHTTPMGNAPTVPKPPLPPEIHGPPSTAPKGLMLQVQKPGPGGKTVGIGPPGGKGGTKKIPGAPEAPTGPPGGPGGTLKMNAGAPAVSPMGVSVGAGKGGTQAFHPPMEYPEEVRQALGALDELRQSPQGGFGGAAVATGADASVQIAETVQVPAPLLASTDIAAFYAAKNEPVPEFYGYYMQPDTKRFKVDQGATAAINREGSSWKTIVRDTESGKEEWQQFVFKPGGREALSMPYYKADAGTYYIRGRMAYDVGMDMPTIGNHLVPTGIVVFDGEVGSLQPFISNTKSLASIRETDYALYQKIRYQSPEFVKFEANLKAYDYIINNPDRNLGNYLVEFEPGTNNFKRVYAIDQDLGMTPGARTVLDANREVVPRGKESMGIEGGMSKNLGKISYTLYEEMQMMVANKAAVKDSMKAAFGATDEVVDSIFERMNHVIEDYTERMATMPHDQVFY